MLNANEDQGKQYATVAKAIAFIRSHARSQPSLKEISDSLGLSEFHLQRVFSEWAGVSPKRFLQYVTKEYAKQALRNSQDLLSVTLEAGLSSPGRLHDLMVGCEAMSPGEIKILGAGIEIRFGVTPTPFGNALIAWTKRGICHVAFLEEGVKDNAVAALRKEWPAATFVQDEQRAMQLALTIFSARSSDQPLHLMLRGTNFQIKVWEALLSVAPGELVSYSQLAHMAGAPKAQRSVGSAVAKNNIALLIPCHRVIRETGEISNYRWGTDRKVALIAWEAARLAGCNE
jgi:AraC family transcriptional regulator of adaptative response/methylated-DNA-[protein]-cysteine methyltransferase